MKIYETIFFIYIQSFFLVFNHDVVIYIPFSCTAALNTATDDVTN